MMRSLFSIITAALAVVAMPSAADDWPDNLRDSIYEGCVVDAPAFDIPAEVAPLTCLCFTVKVEQEWPLGRFGELLVALDEPHDSPTNRRLGELVRSCRR